MQNVLEEHHGVRGVQVQHDVRLAHLRLESLFGCACGLRVRARV